MTYCLAVCMILNMNSIEIFKAYENVLYNDNFITSNTLCNFTNV